MNSHFLSFYQAKTARAIFLRQGTVYAKCCGRICGFLLLDWFLSRFDSRSNLWRASEWLAVFTSTLPSILFLIRDARIPGFRARASPFRVPTYMPWQNSLTFLGEFSLTPTVVYIQMKQFEHNVSPSTITINLLAYVENKEKAWMQIGLRLYLITCRAQRGEKIPAVGMFSLIRNVWKLYNVWPGSELNSLTFPDHSQGVKNNSLIFPKS